MSLTPDDDDDAVSSCKTETSSVFSFERARRGGTFEGRICLSVRGHTHTSDPPPDGSRSKWHSDPLKKNLCQIVVVVVVCGPIPLFRAPTQNNCQKFKKNYNTVAAAAV